MANLEETLQQRSIYGSFRKKAAFIQRVKDEFHLNTRWDYISLAEKEAIDNIIQKLGRVMYGNYHEDNWLDIAGYATLIVKED